MVLHVCWKLKVSERRACQVFGQARGTQRRQLSPPSDEEQLTSDIIALATRYGRYGYRRITAMLNNERGWRVNHKRVARIWRKEGLKHEGEEGKGPAQDQQDQPKPPLFDQLFGHENEEVIMEMLLGYDVTARPFETSRPAIF